jgi:hypothetical protein
VICFPITARTRTDLGTVFVELGLEGYMRAMARRTALVRDWFAFLERYPLVLGPVCAEPPFPSRPCPSGGAACCVEPPPRPL